VRRILSVLAGVLALLALTAVPASAASHKTFHFFSKEISSKDFDANGTPITDPNHTPVVGDFFISTDHDYLGNHKKHAKRVYATDHIICTITAVNLSSHSLSGRCDAQLALPGGMVLIDRVPVDFNEQKTTIPLTGGTGRYAKLKRGTVTTIDFSQKSDNSDLVVRVTY
jgi:hypothetical protein